MFLYTRYHAVVVADVLTVQRMILANTVVNRIIAAGINVIKIGVTLTDYSFPNKSLCRHNVRHLICIRCILRAPININLAGISILKDSSNKEFDFIRRNCLIIGGRIIIPIRLVTRAQNISNFKRSARLNTITSVSRPRPDGINRNLFGRSIEPTIHKLEFAMSPISTKVAITFAREREHNHFISYTFGGKCGSRTNADKCREAHYNGK